MNIIKFGRIYCPDNRGSTVEWLITVCEPRLSQQVYVMYTSTNNAQKLDIYLQDKVEQLNCHT